MISIKQPKRLFRCPMAIMVAMALHGCATTPDATYPDEQWQGWNRNLQSFNDGVDDYVLKPLAKGYQWLAPALVDQGVTNVFSNMDDVGVAINDFLQLKFSQGASDTGRLVVNSTLGLGGIFDVAELMALAKHDEDFGQTLAVWGMPSGPYLVLPFYGPSSPRDTLGLVGDALFNPLLYVSIFGDTTASYATYGAKALEVIDRRADLLTSEKILTEASVDRYEFIKNTYRQHQKYLINDSNTTDDIDPHEFDETPKPSK